MPLYVIGTVTGTVVAVLKFAVTLTAWLPLLPSFAALVVVAKEMVGTSSFVMVCLVADPELVRL